MLGGCDLSTLDAVHRCALLTSIVRTVNIDANVFRNSLTQQEQSLRPLRALTPWAPDLNQPVR